MPDSPSKKDKKDLLSFVVDKKVTESSKDSTKDLKDEQPSRTKKKSSPIIKDQQIDQSKKLPQSTDQEHPLEPGLPPKNLQSDSAALSKNQVISEPLSENLLPQKPGEDVTDSSELEPIEVSNTELIESETNSSDKNEIPEVEDETDYSLTTIKSSDNYLQDHPYFLLSTRYNNLTNKAQMTFFDDDDRHLLYIDDLSGHQPYFIVKMLPNDVKKFIDTKPEFRPVRQLIVDLRPIELQDRLTFQTETRTQIVTSTPLDVPKIREIFRSYNITPYEADIRYHINWAMDLHIIPGMLYTIKDNQVSLYHTNQNNNTITEKERNIFLDFESNKIYKDLIREFLPFFTEPIPEAEIPMVALDIEVKNPPKQFPRPENAQFPISCVSLYSNDNSKSWIYIVIDDKDTTPVTHPELPPDVSIKTFPTETSLLKELNKDIEKFSIVFTFNGDDFDIQYLTRRMKLKKITDSKFSYNARNRTSYITSCIHVDLYKWYSNPAIKSYAYGGAYKKTSLGAITEVLLDKTKIDVEGEISELSYSDLAYYCWNDAKITLELITKDNYQTWKLMILLCRICHVPLEELITKRISSWLMYMLYYEHRSRKYLIPVKKDISERKGSLAESQALIKDKKYQGAIVIEPKPGTHFSLTVLDFASLYPSIISSRNLSYETILCGHPECKSNKIPDTTYYSCTKEIGIFAQLLGFLKDIRVKWFKPLSKDKKHPLASFYKVVEKSLKVLINGAYGTLGAEFFVFYCLPAAEATTAIGRDVLQKTINKSKELGLEVIYGDTDSVFIHSPSDSQIKELITWSEKELGISLEVDKKYKFMTFSQRKKNYIGVLESGEVDIKGLMGKKSNTPLFLQKAFAQMIDVLKTIQSPKDFEKARTEIESIIKVCYSKLEKSKRLNENPEGYSAEELAFTIQMTKATYQYASKVQHVEAARQLESYRQSLGNPDYHIQAGMFIQYIKSVKQPTPLELAKTGLEIDLEAYKSVIHSTFDQVLENLGLDINDITRKKVNLGQFLS